MQNRFRRALAVGAAVLLVITGAVAAGREFLTSRSESATSVTVNGTTERDGWLGLSAYTADQRGKPYHTVIYVRKGSWTERLSLSKIYAGGTYEVALWESKVPKSSCKLAGCKYCPVNGFHMDGMRSYSYGKVGY